MISYKELLEAYQIEKRKSVAKLRLYIICLVVLFNILASLIATTNIPLGNFVLIAGLIVSIDLWRKSRK